MKPRLVTAISAYAVLAVLAGFTLEGMFRWVVWIFLGGLAVKTWIAMLAHKSDGDSD